jgi:hypothetical protein
VILRKSWDTHGKAGIMLPLLFKKQFLLIYTLSRQILDSQLLTKKFGAVFGGPLIAQRVAQPKFMDGRLRFQKMG